MSLKDPINWGRCQECGDDESPNEELSKHNLCFTCELERNRSEDDDELPVSDK